MGKRLLESIELPQGVKNLNKQQLEELCLELREEILDKVSVTGGHLASNLGTVELTVALHYVFDSPREPIVWDVGHQCYSHKLLTGRDITGIRTENGLSGFPKPSESEHDAFVAGHASTSVSAALGIAEAKKINGDDSAVVAVVGDGAASGGMIYEAINNAGRSKTNLIVVLNDNEMSISKNVGAMAKYLAKIRNKEGYFHFKDAMQRFLLKIPLIGNGIFKAAKYCKTTLKDFYYGSNTFEYFGFVYLGPVDGHDISMLIRVLKRAQSIKGPVLVHINTVKGRGYRPAEMLPSKFHGIAPFNKENGELSEAHKKSFSDAFGEIICAMAEKDEKICAITAAMTDGTGLENFAQKYPERFFDVGIAEEHALTFAAGLATGGMKPVFAVYSTFLQRSFDQIIHDASINPLHIVLAIDRAGIVGGDGETHQGVFDISFLSHIPNMTVLSPKNAWELEEMLDFAVNEWNGPIAVRYPRGTAETAFAEQKEPITYGKAEVIQKGRDIAVLAEGHMLKPAAEAAERLEAEGYHPVLVNMRFLNPLDTELLKEIAETCAHIVTVEDNLRKGCFGSKVLEYYGDAGIQTDVLNLAFPDKYIEQGTQAQLFERYGLDAAGIYKSIKERLGE